MKIDFRFFTVEIKSNSVKRKVMEVYRNSDSASPKIHAIIEYRKLIPGTPLADAKAMVEKWIVEREHL